MKVMAQTIRCIRGALRMVQHGSKIMPDCELARIWISEKGHPCTGLLLKMNVKQLRRLSKLSSRIANNIEGLV